MKEGMDSIKRFNVTLIKNNNLFGTRKSRFVFVECDIQDNPLTQYRAH